MVITRHFASFSGSLLAYNTTSHTDPSPRLNVKEGESVLEGLRIVPGTSLAQSMMLRQERETSGVCPNSLVHSAFLDA